MLIKPTAAHWQAFFDALEQRKVWEWDRANSDPKVHNGVYWHASIRYATREPRDPVSSGSNAFPEDFKSFLAAVRTLIGNRKFE